MVEAWSVLRQHSTRLNVEEMLKHMYDLCQELGLMEDLLKLPFTETEQVTLGRKKKGDGEREYIPKAHFYSSEVIANSLCLSLLVTLFVCTGLQY